LSLEFSFLSNFLFLSAINVYSKPHDDWLGSAIKSKTELDSSSENEWLTCGLLDTITVSHHYPVNCDPTFVWFEASKPIQVSGASSFEIQFCFP